jgi:ribosomal protein S18 acetylase RimI-like enzyme
VSIHQTIIRRATVADAQELWILNRDVQDLHAAAVPTLFKAPGPQTFPSAHAAELLNIAANLVWLAYVADQAAGYAYAAERSRPETSSTHPFRTMYLHHLSVRPRYRRQGVGLTLLQAVRSEAAARGIHRLELDVWSFNDGAKRFFGRHGFEIFNERFWTP